MKKVSIIIPNYNGAKYIAECLESIKQQEYQNKEIIVVDDGSNDNSIAIVKKYTGITVIKQFNQGGAIARNRGLEASTGDYIMFLDSDDKLEPNILKKIVRRIEADDSDIVLGSFAEITEKGKTLKTISIHAKECIKKTELFPDLCTCLPVPANKLYKASIIKSNHLYWDNVRIGQDLNFYLKYLLHCKKASVIEDIVFKYRVRQNSISRSYDFRIFDIVNSLANVKKHYLENNALNIYEEYLPIIELRHYNAQLNKAIYYPNKQMRKIIVKYFKAYEGLINYRKCKNFTQKYKKMRLKFRLKCFFCPIFISKLYCKRKHKNQE